MGDDVEVAGRAAARRGLALAGQADLVAVVDAGRHGDPQRALRSVRPSPRQVAQGSSTIWPWPRQRPQGLTLTIWPSIVERT